MKSINAFRAEDGSLHESREGAAVADLVGLGFELPVAIMIMTKSAAIEQTFRQVSGTAYLPVYYPDQAPPSAEAA